jgi:hypothetical protein
VRALALGAAVLAVAVLAACGGEGGGATSTVSTAAQQRPADPGGASAPGGSRKSKVAEAPPTPKRQHSAEGSPTSGAKAVAAGVPVQDGGDNSIQTFGAEGAEEGRSQALAELRAYLGALANLEFGRVCALASSQYRQELAKLMTQAGDTDAAARPDGCPATLAVLLGDRPTAALREISQIDKVLSFRVAGPYAYLIFKGSSPQVMFIAMAEEDGKWKVNVLKPEPFAQADE